MLPVALLVSLAALAAGRIYDRCELARDLLLLGVDRDQVATWVCIAYHESRYDTAAQNYGSGDHGLLQISELYWCGPGKACGAPCSAFRDEDISDDVKCALKIYREHTRLQGDGFLAWVVYPHHCKQNAKKYIVDCDKNLKNTPVKFDDRSRYLKTYDTRYEAEPQVIQQPHRNPVTPRYLAINSIFQGSYVDEFERNYYDNNKQTNWLNFKVENIDDLELPGAVSGKERSYFIESTTRPATVTTLDPALAGIKPPSPRRIESNQFRRRKTFSRPQYLKNRFNDEFKILKTTPVPVRENSERSAVLQEDLSQNIFLNLSPSVIHKSLREFSPQEVKPTDLSRYHVKPQEEVSVVLTLDDLAENPFLNTLPGLKFKSRTESPFRVSNFGQNNYRGHTLTTQNPVASQRSSKQFEFLSRPDIFSNMPEPSRTSSQYSDDENIVVSMADLRDNPFLSRLFHSNNIKLSTETSIQATKLLNEKGNYRNDYSFTTTKPTAELILLNSPNDNIESREDLSEASKNIPTAQRGHDRYTSDSKSRITEKPSTERSTHVPHSTRRYQTISRQRSSTHEEDLKSTTASLTTVASSTEHPKISSTGKTYYYNANRRNNSKIETTTSRSTTSYKTLHNATQENNSRQQNERVPQSSIRTETTANKISTIDSNTKTNITNGSQAKTSTEKINILQTTSKPQTTTSRPWTTSTSHTTSRIYTSRPQTTSRPQFINRIEADRPQNQINTASNVTKATKIPPITNAQITTLPTTRRPYISRFQTTSWPLTASTLQTINKTEITPHNTTKPETMKATQITRSQTTNRPETTTRPTTTLHSWPHKHFWEESRINTPTTPRPWRRVDTWRRTTISSLNPSTTGYVYSSTQETSTPNTIKNTLPTSTTPRASFTWRRPENSSFTSSTAGYFYTRTQKPLTASSEGSTTKTTQSTSTTPRPTFTWRRSTNSSLSSSTSGYFYNRTQKPSTTLNEGSTTKSTQSTSTTPRSIFTWRRPTNSSLSSSTTSYFYNRTRKPSTTSTEGSSTETTQSTTPRSSFTWRRTTNSSLSSSTTGYFQTTTQKPLTTTEGLTAKTTQSIFDLYLRPTTRAPFKPFDFSSFSKLRKSISIFSGGTTKPPINETTKKPSAEDVSRN